MAIRIELDATNRSKRRKWKWTQRMEAQAADIIAVLNAFDPGDLPVTARAVYYRLISSNAVDADHWKWGGKRIDGIDDAINRNLKWLRIDGRIDPDIITDEHRIITNKVGFAEPGDFVDYRLRQLGWGYTRCNAQQQSRHIEVWIEKNTLRHIVEPVADEFCRQVVICRGYLSIAFQTDFYMRVEDAKARGQIPTVLYFGDWDPSGENMLPSIIQTVEDEMGLTGVEYYRCGINQEHFDEIPAAPVPINPGDSRAKRFVEKYGPTAYELDAFRPDRLRELVRDSIAEFTDMSAYERNNIQGDEDRQRIADWADEVKQMAAELAVEHGL